MANVLEGYVTGKGLKFGIVVARFNEFITSKLLSGALDTLHRHEADDADIDVAWVPGAFEIPLVAKKLAASGKYDAVICLGAVIRGSTTHYDYVCNEVSKGVAQVGMTTGVPTIFSVVPTPSRLSWLNTAFLLLVSTPKAKARLTPSSTARILLLRAKSRHSNS